MCQVESGLRSLSKLVWFEKVIWNIVMGTKFREIKVSLKMSLPVSSMCVIYFHEKMVYNLDVYEA